MQGEDASREPLPRMTNAFGGTSSLAGTQVEIHAHSTLHAALCEYAVEHATPTSLAAGATTSARSAGSAVMAMMKGLAGAVVANEVEDARGGSGGRNSMTTSLSLGYGSTEITYESHTFLLTKQGLGPPRPREGIYTTLVLSHPESGAAVVAAMQKLCDAALAEYNTARPGKIALLSFNAKVNSWHRDRMLIKRPLESVILPASCDKVVEEVREFLDADTRRWYLEHGIPYKRTFLLYGPPGCGKSSLIRAVASEFDCSVCMVSLADRGLQDTGLRTAMATAPAKALIAFEDVDALFGHHRERGEAANNVTFSGLLNALDGVSDPSGTIIFLTTNHKDRLDPALIRQGRCDVQVELTFAVDEQLAKCFSRFYHSATAADTDRFVANVRAKAGGSRVTMAQLQEHFVQHRKSTLAEAVKDIRLGGQGSDSAMQSSASIYS
mmetsp:Transcript_25733/g.85764  ORF Transcript_25733/g.85764 Transcript_25733/m.85764 type:complete len:439 (+) Transcript_25733:96-1412(+)